MMPNYTVQSRCLSEGLFAHPQGGSGIGLLRCNSGDHNDINEWATTDGRWVEVPV